MGNFGSAVSQKGYDVKTCADRFLVYSSAFQTLKVFSVSSVTGTIPASGSNTITITHNLGAYAPFVVIGNGTGNNVAHFNSYGPALPVVSRQYANSLQIDIPSYVGTSGNTMYFTVYIFLDDFSTITETNINTGISSGASSTDYGIRISKDGYDVKTCTNEQCVLSSSFFNQIVHKKGIATADVSHNLGYVPNVLVFVRDTGDSYIRTITYEFDGDVDVNTLYLAFSDYMYYIIFKDKVL
ncbi:MAG: hypothetical protein OEV44_01025 [Spirochaetota bacterium]|nr:hypothetical protein [Spirochaetota bacterium]